MRTGISSASLYPRRPTETAVVEIAALGCRLVEVFLQTTREYRAPYARKLASICNYLGVDVHSVHASSTQFEPLLFYPYKRQNLDGLDTVRRVLDCAAILGADCYVFHGPLRITGLDRLRLVAGLELVAKEAADRGIRLALENVSWCAGWEPDVFTWLTSLQIPNLWYTFDSKQARRSGFPAKMFLEAMAGRLVNVHLSDWCPQQSGILPGQGQEDFAGLVTLLGNYSGPALLEVYGAQVGSSAELLRSWLYLQRVLNKRQAQ